MTHARDHGLLLSFLTSRESWIQQNIEFADQKAQTLIAINSAIAGALYAAGFADTFTLSYQEVLKVTALILLVVAVVVSVLVLVPRGEILEGNLSNSIKFSAWTGAKYASELFATQDKALLSDLSAFVSSLARVSSKKYGYIPIAVKFSAFGWLTAGVWVIFEALT